MKWLFILLFIIGYLQTGLTSSSLRNIRLFSLKQARLKLILCLLWSLLLPLCAQADRTARSVCHSKLKHIDAAVHLWAQDNNLSDTNSYTLSDGAIIRYLFESNMVACPSGGSYVAGKTVADSPRCTIHGNLEEMRSEYEMARRRHNGIQIGLGIAAVTLVWLMMRWLKCNESSGRISGSTRKILAPTLLFLLGLLTLAMPQDTLRPTYGIVHPILYAPTAVLFTYGLVVSIRTTRGQRKMFSLFLGVISLVSVFLLSLIIISWSSSLRR
ncbi:MAG: hypothetical protein ACO1QS_16885 [Verrucomicrobiota bacterium]